MSPSRLIGREMMAKAAEADVAAVLSDLRRINRWLGGHRVTQWAFNRLKPPRRFTVLDVGAASGDNGRAIRAIWPGAAVTSLDITHHHLSAADGGRVVADAFRLPVAARGIDYVYCSLFLHHFADDDVIRLLTGFAAVARRGVVVVDLERHRLAHLFMPASRWLFRWHPMTVHDGQVSVETGFTASELRGLVMRAGLEGARVTRHLPWFRLSITWGR